MAAAPDGGKGRCQGGQEASVVRVFVGKFSLLGNVACEDKVFTFSALFFYFVWKVNNSFQVCAGRQHLLPQVTFDETKVGSIAPRCAMPGMLAQQAGRSAARGLIAR